MPRYDPLIHHRRSIRLKGFDYTQPGAYFVTLVTKNRETLFGEIAEGDVRLNTYGQVIHTFWQRLPTTFPSIALDVWIVMPNHLHGILWILRQDGETGETWQKFADLDARIIPDQNSDHPKGTQPGSLGAIVGNFKLTTARRINRIRKSPGESVWQRDYYDDIIRNQHHLDAVRNYIRQNPANWQHDTEYPTA